MCFLISIFLCFALVPKLVPRTVDFHWYWYRILKFWYRDNPNSEVLSLKMNMLPVQLVKTNWISMLLKHLSSCEWTNNVL